MNDQDGLICAYVLDGQGGGRPIGWDEIDAWTPAGGLLWVHLDRTSRRAQSWVREKSGIPAVYQPTLLAEETRPRALPVESGLLVTLRGVNLNPDADPDDMISIRIWLDDKRIVSLRHRRLMAVNDIREQIDAGRGPIGPGAFLAQVSDRLIERMGPVVDQLDEVVDDLEKEVLLEPGPELRHRLSDVRQSAISLRRYLAPQRDTMSRLVVEKVVLVEPIDRAALRETADRVTRYVEDLDAVRERAAVVQDELVNRMSERMNRTMFLLSVVAGVFLPLSFVTGLLGINVAGIPGAETTWAFIAVCVLLGLLAGVEILLFRVLRWI